MGKQYSASSRTATVYFWRVANYSIKYPADSMRGFSGIRVLLYYYE